MRTLRIGGRDVEVWSERPSMDVASYTERRYRANVTLLLTDCRLEVSKETGDFEERLFHRERIVEISGPLPPLGGASAILRVRCSGGAWHDVRVTCRRLRVEEERDVALQRLVAAQDSRREPAPGAEVLPAITKDILQVVLTAIIEELDSTARTAPSFAAVFLAVARDRIPLAKLARDHGWALRTLKHRKRKIEDFLQRKSPGLRLADFAQADRSVFREAERTLADYRARSIRARALLGEDDPDEPD